MKTPPAPLTCSVNSMITSLYQEIDCQLTVSSPSEGILSTLQQLLLKNVSRSEPVLTTSQLKHISQLIDILFTKSHFDESMWLAMWLSIFSTPALIRSVLPTLPSLIRPVMPTATPPPPPLLTLSRLLGHHLGRLSIENIPDIYSSNSEIQTCILISVAIDILMLPAHEQYYYHL